MYAHVVGAKIMETTGRCSCLVHLLMWDHRGCPRARAPAAARLKPWCLSPAVGNHAVPMRRDHRTHPPLLGLPASRSPARVPVTSSNPDSVFHVEPRVDVPRETTVEREHDVHGERRRVRLRPADVPASHLTRDRRIRQVCPSCRANGAHPATRMLHASSCARLRSRSSFIGRSVRALRRDHPPSESPSVALHQALPTPSPSTPPTLPLPSL